MSDNRDNGLPDKDTPPWLQAVPEDEEEGGFFDGRKKLIASAVLGVTALGLFVAAMLYLYNGDDDGPPRHIAAEPGAYREKPEEPGGMDVPFQDKKVFEQADGGTVRENVELADQPEEPLDKLPEDALGAPGAAESDAQQSAPAKADTQPQKQETAPQPKPVQKPAEKPAVKAPAKAAAKVFLIQLGAYGSEATAASAWRTIKGKYANLLGSYTPTYEPVKSGGRTLYRLRVGPMENRAQADEACLGLRAQQQACIVVNP